MKAETLVRKRCSGLALTTCALVLLSLPALAQDQPDRQVQRRTPKILIADGGQGPMKQIIVGRGFLGVNLTQLTPELREFFGGSETAGIMVASLVSGGPADKAGVKVGDLILAINDHDVASHMEVLAEIRKLKGGETANLEVLRDGRRESITVAIEERERQRVDLGEHFNWKTDGDGEFNMFFSPEGEHGALMRQVMPLEAIEGLGDRLKAIDWKELAERSGRSTEELEERLAELEKKLAELAKKLEAASKNR